LKTREHGFKPGEQEGGGGRRALRATPSAFQKTEKTAVISQEIRLTGEGGDPEEDRITMHNCKKRGGRERRIRRYDEKGGGLRGGL